jgi:hypothetical protein
MPDFTQTFATKIFPDNPQLPEVMFIFMSRDPNLDPRSAISDLERELAEDADSPDLPQLQLRDFIAGGKELLETALSWHLRTGTVGRMSMLDLPDYSALASNIVATAEIPVTESPLKGATLASLIGSSLGLMELFHSGVTPTEAVVSVLFVQGAMIIFGLTDAVLRSDLEPKLAKVFGRGKDRAIGAARSTNDRRMRRKRRPNS